MNNVLRVGTKEEPLEIIQAEVVLKQIKELMEELTFELVPIAAGRTLEEAILRNEVDIAVCSAEKIPVSLAEQITIIGIPKRGDSREVLITREKNAFSEGRRPVWEASPVRRRVQLERLLPCGERPEFSCGDIRYEASAEGDDEKLVRLCTGEYDGIVLGASCLKKLELDKKEELSYRYIDCHEFIPAGGQGIVAVMGRLSGEISRMIGRINDRDTALCLVTERRILRMLGADIGDPVGVYARIEEELIHISILYYMDGKMERVYGHAPIMEAGYLAQKLLMELLELYG